MNNLKATNKFMTIINIIIISIIDIINTAYLCWDDYEYCVSSG